MACKAGGQDVNKNNMIFKNKTLVKNLQDELIQYLLRCHWLIH